MHTELMMDDVFTQSIPWLLCSLAFAIIYILADVEDEAIKDFNKKEDMKLSLEMNSIDFKCGEKK